MLKVLFPWKQNNTKKVLLAMEQVPDKIPEEEPPEDLPLLPCYVCSRTFLPQPLKKHIPICEQMSKKKRKPFDSLKQRVEGTDLAPFFQKSYLKKHNPEMSTSSTHHAIEIYSKNKGNKWKEKHLELMNTIKAAKGTSLEANPSSSSSFSTSISKKTVIQTSLNERCPSCDRAFGPKAFDRHVEWCKEHKARMQISPANQQAKERLEARIKYKVPPLRQSKRYPVRDKHSPVSQINPLLQRTNSMLGGKSTSSLGSTSTTSMISNQRKKVNAEKDGGGNKPKKDAANKAAKLTEKMIGDCRDVNKPTLPTLKSDIPVSKSFHTKRVIPAKKINTTIVNCGLQDLKVSSLCIEKDKKLMSWRNIEASNEIRDKMNNNSNNNEKAKVKNSKSFSTKKEIQQQPKKNSIEFNDRKNLKTHLISNYPTKEITKSKSMDLSNHQTVEFNEILELIPREDNEDSESSLGLETSISSLLNFDQYTVDQCRMDYNDIQPLEITEIFSDDENEDNYKSGDEMERLSSTITIKSCDNKSSTEMIENDGTGSENMEEIREQMRLFRINAQKRKEELALLEYKNTDFQLQSAEIFNNKIINDVRETSSECGAEFHHQEVLIDYIPQETETKSSENITDSIEMHVKSREMIESENSNSTIRPSVTSRSSSRKITFKISSSKRPTRIWKKRRRRKFKYNFCVKCLIRHRQNNHRKDARFFNPTDQDFIEKFLSDDEETVYDEMQQMKSEDLNEFEELYDTPTVVKIVLKKSKSTNQIVNETNNKAEELEEHFHENHTVRSLPDVSQIKSISDETVKKWLRENDTYSSHNEVSLEESFDSIPKKRRKISSTFIKMDTRKDVEDLAQNINKIKSRKKEAGPEPPVILDYKKLALLKAMNSNTDVLYYNQVYSTFVTPDRSEFESENENNGIQDIDESEMKNWEIGELELMRNSKQQREIDRYTSSTKSYLSENEVVIEKIEESPILTSRSRSSRTDNFKLPHIEQKVKHTHTEKIVEKSSNFKLPKIVDRRFSSKETDVFVQVPFCEKSSIGQQTSLQTLRTTSSNLGSSCSNQSETPISSTPTTPFELAQRQFMELFENDDDDDNFSVKSSPLNNMMYNLKNYEESNTQRPYTTPILRDSKFQADNNNKRASVIDPPFSFQDRDSMLDEEFELIESLVNNNLLNNFSDSPDKFFLDLENRIHGRYIERKYSDDLASIDPKLINEHDNLSIPENFSDSSDSENTIQNSIENLNNDKLRLSTIIDKVEGNVRQAPDGSSAEVESKETRTKTKTKLSHFSLNNAKNKPKVAYSDAKSKKITSNSKAVQNVKNKKDDKKSKNEKNIIKEDKVGTDDLFPVDDEMYEEYKKYEEIYLKEKEKKTSSKKQKKTADFGINIEEKVSQFCADSAYGSLNRKQQVNSSENIYETDSSKMSKFCHECGNKYPISSAKFCVECGVRRLVL